MVLAGYAAGIPAVIWARRDLSSFHTPLWIGFGNRDAWRRGLIVGLLLGGWPGLFVALGWRTGRIRAELVDERDRWPVE
ncbi:MAG: hypothetical protein ACXVJ7_14345 [Acidimicrobiia bacterium]